MPDEKRKYTFVVTTGISLHVDVEATSLDEATDQAQGAPVMSLCFQCSRGEPGEWSTSGELDGDPTSGDLVEVYVDDEPMTGDEIEALQAKWSGGC